MKILMFVLIAFSSNCFAVEDITKAWCDENFGDKDDSHLVKSSCEAFVFSKQISISPKYFVRSFSTLDKASNNLKRAEIMQKSMGGVGERTQKLLDAYIEHYRSSSTLFNKMAITAAKYNQFDEALSYTEMQSHTDDMANFLQYGD